MKVLPIHSGQQLSLIVVIMLWFLKIIGLAPFSLQHRNKSTRNSRNGCYTSVFLFSKIGLAYNILLSFLIVVLCTMAIPEVASLSYPNKTHMNQAIDITHGIVYTWTACAIIVSGTFKQGKAISIMNRLSEVDWLLCGMKNHSPRKRTLFIFVGMQIIVNSVTWVLFWATEEMSAMSFLLSFIFNVPIFVIQWFVVEYSIVLGVVAMEFESLNKNLLTFEEFTNCVFRTPVLANYTLPALDSPTHCSPLAALELLHSIRTTLSEVSRDIADFCSFSALAAIACFSLTFVYHLWYLFTPIVIPANDSELFANMNSVTWILISIQALISLCYNVVKTLTEAQLTGLVIHKLLVRTRGRETQTELERFSLHLMHEKLNFTAYGFFPLDFTLIQSICGFTASYLVIVVQFMQSAAHTRSNAFDLHV